jgi:hypothetical protein
MWRRALPTRSYRRGVIYAVVKNETERLLPELRPS